MRFLGDIFTHSLINPPIRSGKVASLLILMLAVLLALFPLANHTWSIGFTILSIVLTIFSFPLKDSQAQNLGLFCSILMGMLWLTPTFSSFSLLVYAGIVFSVPQLRRASGWFRFGKFGVDEKLWILAIIILSIVGLVSWYFLWRPDMADLAHRLLPEGPFNPWTLLLAAIGFAMLNAAVEEMMYRGILMQALDSALGVGFLSIIIQALAFGIFHYTDGFPRGVVGVFLAAVYGVLLGILRRRCQGMFSPWLAHVFADLAIFAILAFIV